MQSLYADNWIGQHNRLTNSNIGRDEVVMRPNFMCFLTMNDDKYLPCNLLIKLVVLLPSDFIWIT